MSRLDRTRGLVWFGVECSQLESMLYGRLTLWAHISGPFGADNLRVDTHATRELSGLIRGLDFLDLYFFTDGSVWWLIMGALRAIYLWVNTPTTRDLSGLKRSLDFLDLLFYGWLALWVHMSAPIGADN